MKIKEDLLIRKVGSEYLSIQSVNESHTDFTNAFSMNESAYFLINKFKSKEFTEEDLVCALTEEYEVYRDKALVDVKKLISELMSIGIILD